MRYIEIVDIDENVSLYVTENSFEIAFEKLNKCEDLADCDIYEVEENIVKDSNYCMVYTDTMVKEME